MLLFQFTALFALEGRGAFFKEGRKSFGRIHEDVNPL